VNGPMPGFSAASFNVGSALAQSPESAITLTSAFAPAAVGRCFAQEREGRNTSKRTTRRVF
jgi:hypothetical protein